MKIDEIDRLSLSHLQHNIHALQQVNPALAGRIALPVLDNHLEMRDNCILLKQGQSRYCLNLPLEELLRTINKPEGRLFLFGAGSPDLVKHLLKQSSVSRLVVWDRDPYLLRILLMHTDFSAEIRSGRLQLALGIDIIDFIDGDDYEKIAHPVLQQVYFAEFALLQNGLSDRRVMISPETLYSFEAFSFFRNQGYSVYSLDLKRISLDEIQYAILKFKPELLFVINYISGLAELAHQMQVPVACWEIDPFVDHLKKPTASTDGCFIFCYRPAIVQEFQHAGFKHVYYLPLGADTNLRHPVALKPEEKSKYQAPVSFVGSSMVEQALEYRRLLFAQYAQYQATQQKRNQFEADLEEILQIQRDHFGSFLIQELASHYFYEFIQYSRKNNLPDPIMLISEIAASEKRLNYLRIVARFGLKLWGDRGWKVLESCGARYMGPAGRNQEINKIYSGTQINLDINRLYQSDIVPIRIFDVLACGGFLLAEYSEELERLFDLEKELVCYRNDDELVRKVQYFLKHPVEARRFAEQGRRAVYEKHAFALRMKKILECVQSPKTGYRQAKAALS
ncbi:MAG: glycosyltransferase [candidate division KSB1 bacterium]|nr:glycosyltransferase [candidate division KSB1 bacterium]